MPVLNQKKKRIGMEISIYKNITESKGGEITSVDEFINNVKFGLWKDHFDTINSIESKEERQKAKKNVPYVTISGLFNHRKASDIVRHSGFICLDFDDVEDIEEAFENLSSDHFTYACFRSISGRGLAAIVKIDPKKHLDAFLGLEAYFANKYQLYVDRSCKDVSRARFVSFDTGLFNNQDSQKFTSYIPKSEKIAKSKLPNIITGENDIDFIIEQINGSSVDITNSSYLVWMEIGFAISEEYGERGREYYHAVSYYSEKYDPQRCDKQYNRCIKHDGNGITFATFLHYVREAGLSILTDETKHIITSADIARNAGRGVSDIVHVLKEVDGLSEEITRPIVEKVLARAEISQNNKLSKIESLEIFINSNYRLKRNEITRAIESGSEELDSKFFNTVYIRARKEVDDKIKYEEIDRLIGSDFIESYNPIIEFFEKNAHEQPKGMIQKLCDSIDSPNEYKDLFIKKWLVGAISAAHGVHSPLMLALTGGQNTGKTQFFRRLMPDELKSYYAESKLDAGKDDEILMCQKWFICDDEFGGKSKNEAKRLKELTSKDFFTLREPYGRNNVRLKRFSVLCGTSNDEKILNDPTGNRRIIPVSVRSIDFDLYNSIDKKLLLIEAYHLYKNGFKWETSAADILALSEGTDQFEQVVIEKEMIMQFFKLPSLSSDTDPEGIVYLQASEIKSEIERKSLQRINIFKLTAELLRLGFVEESRKVFGNTLRVYQMIRLNEGSQGERGVGGDDNIKPIDLGMF